MASSEPKIEDVAQKSAPKRVAGSPKSADDPPAKKLKTPSVAKKSPAK